MKHKIISAISVFSTAIIIIIGIFTILERQINPVDKRAGQIVALNEIEQLTKSAISSSDTSQTAIIEEKIGALQSDIKNSEVVSSVDNNSIIIMIIICVLFIFMAFGYIYIAILSPFNKMKNFVGKIAQGEFDIPLNYERSNYFGEFTWAFDNMRREITKARSCEREAIENNKTVIATLSHDIKTPISSIRTYAEGLEANMDRTPEKRARYLGVIMQKCDEVSKLTNDLFLHSISDLDKLKINTECFELCGFLEKIILEIAGEKGDIIFIKPSFNVNVSADKNRLVQVVENIINNSRKYAGTKIDICIQVNKNDVNLHFRDYGQGIPDEDMPFIFNKFYRGRNCGNQQGSGLGLYIVKYISEQMNGQVLLHNHSQGLEVVLSLPVKL